MVDARTLASPASANSLHGFSLALHASLVEFDAESVAFHEKRVERDPQGSRATLRTAGSTL